VFQDSRSSIDASIGHIDISKSIRILRCRISTYPNRFRCFDVAHRHIQIDFDASMPHIDMSKSIWMLRCPTSTCPHRFRCFDVAHRHVHIDFDASMSHIDMSTSISMLRIVGISKGVDARLEERARSIGRYVNQTRRHSLYYGIMGSDVNTAPRCRRVRPASGCVDKTSILP
jgi:hypothetical protein